MATVAELEADFRRPPDSARPWVYWFWMDGNLSREGISADLEAMKRVGIGGLIIMEVDVGIPKGPVKFMSEPWRALFRHAVTEAERLGLEVTLNAGPGWTGSGGPWVKPEQSMQHIVAAFVNVTGPSVFKGALPRPAAREPHFVHAPLPPALRQAREEFYRDVAVLAFPTPADGPGIADIDEKALYYRNPYSSHPGVKPSLPAPAEFPESPAGVAIAGDSIVELTDKLEPDGRLVWNVPEGAWTIMRFGCATTGANTRPAPEPGIGLECDKFNPSALEAHFDAFIGALWRELGPRPASRKAGWTMLHIDSWEMGAQNWTANFRAEFRDRRGYDPMPYLPAVTGQAVESLEVSERFLWDLRQTAQELVIENHARRLQELGRGKGFGLSIEPYDMNPCSDLSLGGVADVPMCEFWAQGYGFDTAFSCFEAASIAHTMGRPIVAAEAFTAGEEEAWMLHPGAMKAQADWAFCVGINRLVVHRYAHQPWLDRSPGMTMGPYGVHYERTQTWWELTSAWHDYLSRCQFLLRQGLYAADICYLAPEGAPHVFRPPRSALRGPQPVPDRRGYNFDGCAPEALIARASVEDGRLVMPDGMSYQILVLPEMETMRPALLRKLSELVERGATVMGPPPRKSPSLSGYPQCDAEVRKLANELWGKPEIAEEREEGPGFKEHRFGKGRIIWGGVLKTKRTAETADPNAPASLPSLYPEFEPVVAVLARMGVRPDFEGDEALRYAHRSVGEMDIYFVANRENARVAAVCTFRVSGRQPEVWDPLDGTVRTLPEFGEKDGRTVIPLEFEPHGSYFVVFRQDAACRQKGEGKNFPLFQTAGEIAGPWTVMFQAHRGAPERIILERLSDLSRHPDSSVKYFSGLARYGCEFEMPDLKPPLFLDLGDVEVMARIKLNGTDLGVVWKQPFRLEISEAVRRGRNSLEVTVANLWPNRLIGDQSLPPQRRIAWTTWNPYTQGKPLLPSGLLGPVTVLTRQ
ncbi:MAG: glycosyl hydrolase [Acidobacteriota bacterium]